MQGQGDTLRGSANVDLRQLRSLDAPRGLAVDGTLNADLTGDVLRLSAQAHDGSAVQATADVSLPVETSAAPLRLAIARTRPLSGNVSIQGQVQPIWDLFLGGERSLSGNVNGQATIAGTLNAPRLNGRLDLADGSYFEGSTGTRLNALNLATRFDDTTAYLERFSANDGDGGTVSGEGRTAMFLGVDHADGHAIRQGPESGDIGSQPRISSVVAQQDFPRRRIGLTQQSRDLVLQGLSAAVAGNDDRQPR